MNDNRVIQYQQTMRYSHKVLLKWRLSCNKRHFSYNPPGSTRAPVLG